MDEYANGGGVRKLFAKYYYLKIYQKYNCCIFPSAVVGKGFKVYHPVGIVIGKCKIGTNCTILQNVTIGEKVLGEYKTDNTCYPIIGNDVIVGAGACILGGISVFNNICIGANAVVLKDLKYQGAYGGIPVKMLKKNISSKQN